MPDQKLFNQPLQISIADTDRIAFAKTGDPVSGAKNIVWSALKNLIQKISFGYLDFTPQNPPPTEQEGRAYYNDINKAYEFYTEVTGLQPFRVGRTLRSRVLNNTGLTIPKGKFCKIVNISGTSPIVELSDNSEIKDIKLIVGMSMADILTGEHGYLAVFDTVIGVNTSGMSVNDLIYTDPANLGGFTNIEPQPPFASYPVGFVSVVDAVSGVVGIRIGGFTGSDTSINLKGYLNGVITHTPDVQITSDGVTITASVTNEEHPTEDLAFLLNDKRYLLDTTPAATIAIPAGADASTLQTSILYIYLNSGVPTLAVATSEPAVPFVRISEQACFDAVRTQTDGKPFAYRRTNNSIDLKNGVNDGALGLMVRTTKAIRKKLGSNWLSGQDATPTVNNTNIQVALSAGVGMQFNESNLPLFNGVGYIVYNDTSNNVTYSALNDLISIITDASGNTLLSNNTFYTIRLFYQLNSNGIGNNIIATRPLNAYSTSAEAIQDPSNFTINVNDTDIEEIIYPLYDIVIARTGSGGTTVNLVQLTDLRTKLAGGVGGGGASGGGGTDDKVRVSANDTTNDYLLSKLNEGSNIRLTTLNPAANEKIDITSVWKNDKTFSKGTLNISTGEDVFNYDDNGNEQLIYTGEGTTLIELNLFIENIGTNPNGATANVYINDVAILSSNITLSTGLTTITSINLPTIAKGDIVELRMIVNTGSGTVSNGWLEIKAV